MARSLISFTNSVYSDILVWLDCYVLKNFAISVSLKWNLEEREEGAPLIQIKIHWLYSTGLKVLFVYKQNIPIHVLRYLKLFTIVLVLSAKSRSCFIESAVAAEDDPKCLEVLVLSAKSRSCFIESAVAAEDDPKCLEVLVLSAKSRSCFIESAVAAEDDPKCLEGLKSSLYDPEGKPDMETGTSRNESVRITSGVSEVLSKLAGTIPPELGDCIYLNTLILSNNSLSGHILYQLSYLVRLKVFSVAYNNLSGEIPPISRRSSISRLSIDSRFSADPLESKLVGQLKKRNPAIIVTAGAFGATVSLLSSFVQVW
ncbi:hypothetical protein Ddye_015094 [Dipteronia dyeriana]|uniref:Uncharacterized protein n=1 Tax=Dipteronia dyeriana TaxID=168575 RepID=A0AAD9U525_9ROSI|nr:hypothetical protein Ddye_015094 [Dipteronia dyeriana]